jgi:hypothetical protein
MRSLNACRAWFAVAALATCAVEACGGSNGTIQGTIGDAAVPDAASGDASSSDATGLADATAADGKSPGPDASVDAPGGSDGSDGSIANDSAPDGPEICNMVANAAPAILSTVADAATPPAQTGMPIASGTYFLTSATSYGGTAVLCGDVSVKGTVVVAAASTSAGTLDGVIEYSLGALKTTRTVHATYVASGSALSLTATCPTNDAGATTTQYSATPTTITVVQPAPMPVQSCGDVLEVFTKQ